MIRLTLIIALFAPGFAEAQVPPRVPDADNSAPKKPAVKGQNAEKVSGELIAIGDIHGDYGRFLELLRKLELVDKDGHWAGGDTTLVQTGDMLDRGLESREIVNLLMRLEREAKKAGGEVVVLLGNHEVMNFVGWTSYVDPREIARYAREETKEHREKRRREIQKIAFARQQALKSDFYTPLQRESVNPQFDRAFPPGLFAYLDTFSERGKQGRWLLKRRFLYKTRGILFVHAGLDPEWGAIPAKELDERLHKDLRTYLDSVAKLEKLGVYHHAFGQNVLIALIKAERRAGGPTKTLAPIFDDIVRVLEGPLFVEEGPMWYRGMALNDEKLFQAEVDKTLAAQGVDRVVIGHTQDPTLRIKARFSGSVIMIDTGMNHEVYRGTPSALIVDKNRKWTTYP